MSVNIAALITLYQHRIENLRTSSEGKRRSVEGGYFSPEKAAEINAELGMIAGRQHVYETVIEDLKAVQASEARERLAVLASRDEG